MQFRFTLSNTIAGSQVINDPDGWQDIKVKLERDQKFHSLIEKIEVPLIFWGNNGVVDGGYDYITNVITTQGYNAIVTLLIEISEDEGETYEDFYEGNLELSDKQEFSEGDTFYKLQCPIIQTSLWSKFFNRIETPVDLQSATDLDGNAVDVVDPIELNLISQLIKQRYDAYLDRTAGFPGLDGILIDTTDNYVQFDWNIVEREEIEEKFSLIVSSNPDIPVNLFKIKFAGQHLFNITIDVRDNGLSFVDPKTYLNIYLRINGTDYLFTKTDIAHAFGNPKVRYTYSATHTLFEGDEITVYGIRSTDDDFYIYYQFEQQTPEVIQFYNNISIIAETSFTPTTTDALLIHDVFKSITERITGQSNSFYSELFGGVTQGYAEDGCNYKYAQMRGLHVRGYSFADKPFFQSMKDQWDGADPIFNLGLGYEDLNQSPYERVIRVEDKAYFYDPTISVNLDNVDNIKNIYDKNFIFKSINIGYQKWSSESSSGIDDPQTKKTYATLFEQIGTPSTLLSRFFAAALAIEQARRLRVEKSKDYRLDEEVMIIALATLDSPLDYYPELDENFSDITNLNNPESRYNLRLTPAWNFLRWINYFKGCLESNYSTSDFKFTGGEGNYDFEARMDDLSDCILGAGSPDDLISEKGDIQADIKSDYLHLPDMYEFNFKLSWSQYKTIRNARNKAIGVSQSDAGHETCFINLLEWSPTDATADFKVWLK